MEGAIVSPSMDWIWVGCTAGELAYMYCSELFPGNTMGFCIVPNMRCFHVNTKLPVE